MVRKNKGNKKAYLGIILALFVLAGLIFALNFGISGKVIGFENSKTQLLESRSEMSKIISESSFIKDMPEKGFILIKLIEENKEESYIIIGKSLKMLEEQSNSGESPDMMINLDLTGIEYKGRDLCEVAKEANEKEKISFKTNRESISLLWKYRNMLKYRGCIGY